MTTGLEDLADSSRPRRRPGRPATLDRDAVLEAARGVIAERGLERARYADVSAAAGVPVTTLQHAFGSLQAMLVEALRRATANEIEYLRRQGADSDAGAWDRLQEFVRDAILAPAHLHAASWSVWLELWRLVARDETFALEAAPLYQAWQDYVIELVAEGAGAGEFSGPMAGDPVRAALAVNAIIDGIAISMIMRAGGDDRDGATVVALDAVAVLLGRTPGG